MANTDITKIPAPRTPLIDENSGDMTPAWYRFFYNIFTILGDGSGILPTTRGGTGQSIYANGQLLIGNGVTGSLNKNTLTGLGGINIVNGPGTIAIENTGVTSVTAGPGIDIDVGVGDITISNTGVLSFNGGSTGLLPNTSTNGNVTLSGVLNVANGGTGANTPAGARANLSAAVLGANNDITSLIGVTGPIKTPTYVDFNTAPTFTDQIGRMGWNASDQTLNLGMDYGVTQQIGQETYARVKNETGVTIPNGTAVGFVGASSDALSVAPYLADGSSPSLYILGIMTHDLPDSGEKGYCTTWGFVRDLDTSAFSVGDILYPSPSVAGELTNVKPTAPNNVIPIAAVITSNATTGVIFVRPTITQMQYYGIFAKTADTSPAVINTAYPITFDTTNISNGVVIGGTTSQIIVPQSGLYQFSATVQLTSNSGVDKNIWVWFRKNGTDIANSARLVTTSVNGAYTPVSVNEAVSLAANGYVELVYAANSTNVTIDAVASTAFAPSAPAVVLEVTQVQQ
jgi:hypothetical protein